jgi:hypothetical protein
MNPNRLKMMRQKEKKYSGLPSRVTDFMSPSSEANERPWMTSLEQFTKGTREAK